jgi:hypothetical protein
MGLRQFPGRPTAAAAFAAMLTLLGPGAGCGPATPDVEPAARYSPESLAQELAFRYRALTPDAKTAKSRNRGRSNIAKSIAALESAEKLQTKSKGAPTAKKARVETLDDLLDDLEGKLSQIKDISRLDACRRASEAISKDASLSDTEKRLLSDKFKELGETSS